MDTVQNKIIDLAALSELHSYNQSHYVDKTDVTNIEQCGISMINVKDVRSNLRFSYSRSYDKYNYKNIRKKLKREKGEKY